MQTAIEKIRELRTLHEDGLLSRDEFDRRKEAILDTAYHDARANASTASEGTELGLMAGQEVGQPARRYRLQRLIAHGGMTEVWQAVDLATEAQLGHNAQVALKIHPPQRSGATHEARLLLEEAICARRLTHENIVRVHDWSQDAATGSVFLVMEYLDGEDLDALIARTGGVPLERACALLDAVGQALDYAWDKQRLVHRDLKPANVFVQADGIVKLLDFGIAGSVQGSAAPGNSGTAAYRAPEAADPQLVPDRALDVHAAAVMLYRMVAGALPFDGKRREQAAPRENALPGAVRAALHAGFAPDPSMRPPSVSALLRRVREAMAAQAPAQVPAQVWSPVAAPATVPEPVRAPAAVVTPLRATPVADPAVQRRELERRAREAAQAEREARRQTLREQLRRRLEQDAEQERTAQSKPVQRRAEILAGAAASPFMPAGEQMMSSRLSYASTGTPAAPSSPRSTAGRSDEMSGSAGPRGRLRDRFLDDSSQSPELVMLTAGRFLMGSGPVEQQLAADAGARKAWLEREGPRHAVNIANQFAIGRLPVTVGQWREFVVDTRWKSSGEVSWAAPGFMQTDEHPVVGISWHDAQLYVRWLSARTGKRYRLPTEAEWEYACRAGTATPFNVGENIRPDQANYDSRFSWSGNERGVPRRGTTAAGSYPANAWGLCDMHGNVWEWVQDVMHDSYEGAPGDGSAWEDGGDQNRRVLRGGSWLYHPRYLRSAVRNGFASRLSNDKVGFRIVREVE
jgi:formylglycine-generating enzyme required for sulfatase activity